MNWIFGRTAMWIWATLALATAAFAAVQTPQLPEGNGKAILQTACTACHDLNGVVNMHLDKDGWEGLVSSMISNGAQVDQKDYPVLIDYLVKNFGSGAATADAKPAAGQAQTAGGDDAAKQILQTNCTTCHDLDQVQAQHLDKAGWKNIVDMMVAFGATINEKDSPVLIEYLAKTYGPAGGAGGAGGAGSTGAGPAQAANNGGTDGKTLLQNNCTGCHDLDQVQSQHLDKDGWKGVIDMMLGYGAQVNATDVPVLVEYLANTYGPKK